MPKKDVKLSQNVNGNGKRKKKKNYLTYYSTVGTRQIKI